MYDESYDSSSVAGTADVTDSDGAASPVSPDAGGT